MYSSLRKILLIFAEFLFYSTITFYGGATVFTGIYNSFHLAIITILMNIFLADKE